MVSDKNGIIWSKPLILIHYVKIFPFNLVFFIFLFLHIFSWFMVCGYAYNMIGCFYKIYYVTNFFTQLQAMSLSWHLLQWFCLFYAKNLQKFNFRGFREVNTSKILGGRTQPLLVLPDSLYNFFGSLYNIQFEPCNP